MSFRIAILLVLSVGSTANRVNSKLALDVERLDEKEKTYLNKSIEKSDDKMKSGIGLTNKTADVWDTIMDSHMEDFATAFFKAANAEEDDLLSKTKWRSVVQANDCIRHMLEVRDSEVSQLPGWQHIYKEIDTDGDGRFSKDELVEVFQNRGAFVMQAAESRARNAFEGMQGDSGKEELSKTSVKNYIKEHASERAFLKIGERQIDGTRFGWAAFFSFMGEVKNQVGELTVDDLITVYKFREMNLYPGDCFPVGATTILGVASPVEESEVVKTVEPSTVEVVVPPVVTIAGNIVAQLKFGIQIQNALAQRAPASCRLLQDVFLKMDQTRENCVTVKAVNGLLDRLSDGQKEEELAILTGIVKFKLGSDEEAALMKTPFQFSDLVKFKLGSDEEAACTLEYRGKVDCVA